MVEIKPVKEVPKKVVRSRSSRYVEIVKQFLESKQPSVEVVLGEGDPKPNTVYQQLVKAIKKEGITGVQVVRRGEQIFLVRGE